MSIDLMKPIESSLYRIKNILKADSEIRKLLYYTTEDALEKSEVSYTKIDDYISLFPIYNLNQEPYNKSNFITINLIDFVPEEDDLYEGILQITVISKNTDWQLKDNKIRVLRLAGLIQKLLNNQKFDASHKLNFISLKMVRMDEEYSGYNILFEIYEGGGLENDF